MTISQCVRYHIPFRLMACLVAGCLCNAVPSLSQKPTPKQTAKPVAKRPPLTEADVLKLWQGKDEALLLNEIKLRSLAFEPEEEWVAELKDPADQPLAIKALREKIPPAPTPDAVAAEAPALLSKIKDAAQSRSESALQPLVHPKLLPNKSSVYDLFDIANYRNHSLGLVTPMENRRVGVQFFQLTTSQVERLHYLVFSSYHGKIVLRDVMTGPKVAEQFLKDEEKLATSKLDLMFRALNDRDESGLKNLCTPGLYDSLKRLTEGTGSTLMRGKFNSISAIGLTPSVSLDQKSARVVVRVSYPITGDKPLQYDIDFERIGKDLKVVRVRDLQGGVIAWDPDIDNYLNERYGLPKGEPVKNVAESDDPRFQPLSRIRLAVIRAIESHEGAALKNYATEFLAREPGMGDGYGIRAAAEQMLGSYDDAAKDATLAIDRGGVAYFVVSRHVSSMTSMNAARSGNQFSPVILGVSKANIEYHPFTEQGAATEEIPTDSVIQSQLEKSSITGKARPFLNLEFNNGGKKTYNFAALGTMCPGDKPSMAVEPFPGGSVCPAAPGAQPPSKGKGGILGRVSSLPNPLAKNSTVPLQVPHNWHAELKVVADAIDQARRGGSAQAQK